MAGDWIKMRIDLYEDPAVIQMAESLGVREEVIVGFLHRIWSWVSRQCHGGTVTNVTLVSLGRVNNLPDFPELMVEVGWLEYTESDPDHDGKPVIRIPKFDRHLSQGAKERALAASRKRHARVPKMSRSKRDKSVTREEKRRDSNRASKEASITISADESADATGVGTANTPLERRPQAARGNDCCVEPAEAEWQAAVRSATGDDLAWLRDNAPQDNPKWKAEWIKRRNGDSS